LARASALDSLESILGTGTGRDGRLGCMKDDLSCWGDGGGRSGDRMLIDTGLGLVGEREVSGVDTGLRGGGKDGSEGFIGDFGLPTVGSVSCPIDCLFEMRD